MKNELSQHKLKEKTLVCFPFYPPLLLPFILSLNKLELVEVVEPTH
jgi:hypothetical protein